jgi:hypothetical protein
MTFRLLSTTSQIILGGLALYATTVVAQSHPFIPFDAPGGTFGTFPAQINDAGQIAGSYQLVNSNYGGFIRNPDGQITEFEVPSATITLPFSINGKGQVVGYAYSSFSSPARGFLRSASGRISQIVYPGGVNTWPDSINDSGVITGQYGGLDQVYHSFVRDAAGVYTSIDAPGAGSDIAQGTFAWSINQSGEIAGDFKDSNYNVHGFIRDAAGNITTFDVPGATNTNVGRMNNHGEITGVSLDSSNKQTGFTRLADGTFTTFTSPGVHAISANSINDSGYVCGLAYSFTNVQTGFLRTPSGNFVEESGPQPNPGGQCTSVNNNQRATGVYSDIHTGGLHAWVK